MNELSRYGIVPVSYSTVAESLPEYRSVRDKISSMERQGELMRIRKGFYVVSPEVSNQSLSLELIANHLYGPSYVSLVSALSYYGLIPERVQVVTSVTMRRSRGYNTPLGAFEYTTIPENYYPVGIRQMNFDNEYTFLMASPEKALCDLIITTSGLRMQSARAVRLYLYEDLRIDTPEQFEWDLSIIRECINHGRKRRELQFLLEVLQNG